jgi:hypothetical protein
MRSSKAEDAEDAYTCNCNFQQGVLQPRINSIQIYPWLKNYRSSPKPVVLDLLTHIQLFASPLCKHQNLRF